MNNDYENLDEELENENLSEEIDEQPDSDYQNQLEDDEVSEQEIPNIPNTSDQPNEQNNQNSSNYMKEIAKSTAITGATALGVNSFNKFSRTNLGRSLITKGQNTLNTLNQSNNPLAKLAANKANRMINPLKGIANNNPLPPVGAGGLNPLQKKDAPAGNSSLGAKAQGLGGLLNGKGNASSALSGLMGGKKGGTAALLGSKKMLIIKLKIIGAFAALLAAMFGFLFIWFVIDGDEQGILDLTDFGFDDNSVENVSYDSVDDFLNTDHDQLPKSLIDTIGYDDIVFLTDRINSVNTGKCSGYNVAGVLLTLIDGMGKLGYKLPYGIPASEYQIVNQEWGKTIDNNVIGFNEYTLIDWALTTAGINNPVTSIEGYNDRDEQIDLVYSTAGDLVINNDKGYIIAGSTGEKVTLVYIDEEGVTYKVLTYQELANYTVIDMSSYYSANCKN